ncbi:MAG: glycosyltransferase family 9 protein [Bdellovibrionales bacterium]|nr:glycosyltransferase family 9 protein [Bdellovibrionales bacterium]MBT3525293.1 glycosyltransferase family 9 protein [Bdellovibrionales bacterium]MBT7766057.1 glycosyltransferase family 9 protein [Bdellovibrionales bacterium]
MSQHFILVKNRALGDAIMGLGGVQYACALYPDAKITYLVPAWVAPLFEQVQLNSFQIEIYGVDWNTLSGMVKLWRYLRSLGPLSIHEMHQAGRGGKFFGLYSFIHRDCKYTYHNHHLSAGNSPVLDQGEHKELIQRDIDGFFSFWGSGDQEVGRFLEYSPVIGVRGANSNQGTIILGVVATRATKMWPLKNFVSLVQLLISNNCQQKIVIPISSSTDDLQIKKELVQLGLDKSCQFLQVSLSELPARLVGAACYIGNDTGLKHLACALGVRTITLFGPEPPREWHPYDHQQHPYFYQHNLECRTTTYHYCPLSTCESMRCLEMITPRMVCDAI